MERRPVILAVDDEPNILKLLSINFSIEGYKVLTAPDGASALVLLEEYPPDLVILDIMMPDITGYEMIQLIRKQSDVPIIMLTARDDMASIEKTLISGADDYITKPFNFRLLSSRVKSKIKRTEMLNAALQIA